MATVLEPLMVIPRTLTFDAGNGLLGVHWPPGAQTVLSVQPDGTIETRPGVGGPYELFTLVGDALYVTPSGFTYGFRCPKL